MSEVKQKKRLDAGIYSKEVKELFRAIDNYKHGNDNIFSIGFELKRGPNLAKRDLGRSIKTQDYKPNYHLLIYPSDISDAGYILNFSYIGARNPIWYLKNGDILFSAEGSVGKNFVICNEKTKFTTNFHGIIISPNGKLPIEMSAFLGLFLNYLREKGIIQKMSVGGQGGSFAVNYWDLIKIPNFPNGKINQISKIYHNDESLNPFVFDKNKITKSGIFELSNFRFLCKTIIHELVKDIKDGNLQNKNSYENFSSIF